MMTFKIIRKPETDRFEDIGQSRRQPHARAVMRTTDGSYDWFVNVKDKDDLLSLKKPRETLDIFAACDNSQHLTIVITDPTLTRQKPRTALA